MHIYEVEVAARLLMFDADGITEGPKVDDEHVLGNGTFAFSLTYIAVTIADIGNLYLAPGQCSRLSVRIRVTDPTGIAELEAISCGFGRTANLRGRGIVAVTHCLVAHHKAHEAKFEHQRNNCL